MASSAVSLLVEWMLLGKKCFTVSVGDGKVGDTAGMAKCEHGI